MKYRIYLLLAIASLGIVCCNKSNKTSKWEDFIRLHKNANLSIFNNWSIEPREGEEKSGIYYMKYVSRNNYDTTNQSPLISLFIPAQQINNDSIECKIDIDDIYKKAFCEQIHINPVYFNQYIDSVFRSFLNLNIQAISGYNRRYLLNFGEGIKLLRCDSILNKNDSTLFKSLKMKAYGDFWYNKDSIKLQITKTRRP